MPDAPGDGSAAVPSEPRRWTLYVCPECGGLDDSPLPHRHGMGLKQHTVDRRSVTVEEVGPVSEAQESVARMRELTESVRARNARIHEGVAEVEAGARALEGESTTTLMQRRSAARAVLSAVREVKSDGD